MESHCFCKKKHKLTSGFCYLHSITDLTLVRRYFIKNLLLKNKHHLSIPQSSFPTVVRNNEVWNVQLEAI